MPREIKPIALVPEQFEREVKAMLQAAGGALIQLHTEHRERVEGIDGAYEIDVTVRFEALGGDFLVLVECKQHSNPIKREVVQVLHDRVRSVGAHKGMLFATTSFQQGAIEYASIHGIALIQVTEGKSTYITKDMGPPREPPPWAQIEPYVGYLVTLSDGGLEMHQVASARHIEALRKFLSERP